MATAYFNGKAKWARLQKPDEKYNKYSIAVGLDAKQFKELQGLKIRNAGKLDDDGVFWVNFHRKASDGAPKCTDPSGSVVNDLIGNDSEVTIKVEIFSWTNKETGSIQHAAKLDSVRVDKLIRYVPNGTSGVAAEKRDTPVAETGKGPSSLPEPKGKMF